MWSGALAASLSARGRGLAGGRPRRRGRRAHLRPARDAARGAHARRRPSTPRGSRREQRHSDVVVAVTVDESGHVSSVEVLESGGPDLDGAATGAARGWTFTPATRDGVPLASRIKIPFHFAPPASRRPTSWKRKLRLRRRGGRAAEPARSPGGDARGGEYRRRGRHRASAGFQARTHGASDYQVEVGELRAVPRGNASDALSSSRSGVPPSRTRGGSGHAEQVFLRGFDAHEEQDLEFTVDGVPINDAGNYHGNVYADTHFILPELIQSVRVLEGPYAPQQGRLRPSPGAPTITSASTARGADDRIHDRQLRHAAAPPPLGSGRDAPGGTFAGAEYVHTTNGFRRDEPAGEARNGHWSDRDPHR